MLVNMTYPSTGETIGGDVVVGGGVGARVVVGGVVGEGVVGDGVVTVGVVVNGEGDVSGVSSSSLIHPTASIIKMTNTAIFFISLLFLKLLKVFSHVSLYPGMNFPKSPMENIPTPTKVMIVALPK